MLYVEVDRNRSELVLVEFCSQMGPLGKKMGLHALMALVSSQTAKMSPSLTCILTDQHVARQQQLDIFGSETPSEKLPMVYRLFSKRLTRGPHSTQA